MSLNPVTQHELKQLIDNCESFEGRYYLLYLYESLIKSEQSDKTIEHTANELIALIKNINIILDGNQSADARVWAVPQISRHYNALAKETGINGVFYKSKQALLDLGGLIIGIVAGVFGAVLGSLSMAYTDIINFRLPTGMFIGAFTGLFVGFTLGRRAPHTLFKDSEQRLIRHAVKNLESTFESLFQSVTKDYSEEVRKEILEEYFDGDTKEYDAFLHEKQKYEILGIEASFFSASLKGSMGHHSFIKFTINNREKPKLIEMGIPSDQETVFSQRESREATGEQLVKMLAMDKLLRPQYEVSLGNLLGFYRRYKAGVNDCHTYVDKILLSVGEPVSQIKRFTPDDTVWGRIIGKTMTFFRPLPDKLQHCDPINGCHRINTSLSDEGIERTPSAIEICV